MLQAWSPCLMSDVNFCRMKMNKVDAIRTLDLVFDIRFDIPPGDDAAYTIFSAAILAILSYCSN